MLWLTTTTADSLELKRPEQAREVRACLANRTLPWGVRSRGVDALASAPEICPNCIQQVKLEAREPMQFNNKVHRTVRPSRRRLQQSGNVSGWSEW